METLEDLTVLVSHYVKKFHEKYGGEFVARLKWVTERNVNTFEIKEKFYLEILSEKNETLWTRKLSQDIVEELNDNVHVEFIDVSLVDSDVLIFKILI